MKEMTFNQMITDDIDIKNIGICRINYPKSNIKDAINDYTGSGRRKNLIHIVKSGYRHYVIGSKNFDVGGHSLIFIPDNTRYYSKRITEKEYDGVGITFDIYSGGVPVQLPEGIYTEWNVNLPIISELADKLQRCFTLHPEGLLFQKSAVFAIAELLFAGMADISHDKELIQPALDFMAEHYAENLPVKRYADLCLLSESYFRKVFSAQTGMSPIEYRNVLRFNKAKQLYRTGQTVYEISKTVGFNSPEHFSKAYKKSTGYLFKTEKMLF